MARRRKLGFCERLDRYTLDLRVERSNAEKRLNYARGPATERREQHRLLRIDDDLLAIDTVRLIHRDATRRHR